MSRVRRTSRLLLTVLVLSTIAITQAPAPVDAAFPGRNGRIFFYRQVGDGPEDEEIFSNPTEATGNV